MKLKKSQKKTTHYKKRRFFPLKKTSADPLLLACLNVEDGIGQIDTQELLNGTILAIDTINRQGGINGRELRLETAGFRVNSPQSILNAYHSLFDREIDAISTSYACYSAEIHELAASKGIPYLHIATHKIGRAHV